VQRDFGRAVTTWGEFTVNNFCARWAAVVIALVLAVPASGQQKIPVILDTDIGSDIDDAFALGVLLNSPEVELRGVATCASDPDVRAWIVCRLLTAVGKKAIPVAIGAKDQPEHKIEGQFQYRYHPAALFNRTAKPVKQDAVEFLYEQLKADAGKITILTTGPLTNIAALLKKHPDCQPWIKRIVISGGAVPDSLDKKWLHGSFNLALDPEAFKAVTDAKLPIVLVPGQWTALTKLSPEKAHEYFKACTQLTFQVQSLYQLWDGYDAVLSDAAAARVCIDDSFGERARGGLQATEAGGWQFNNNKGEDVIINAPIQPKDLLKWTGERLTQGKQALPKPMPNPANLIPAEKFPNRVHAFEDFETDIEKRWWMSGKLEKKINAPGGGRCLRGVLTQDFDDRQGDMNTMYTAVIFNPVPGPPMGKNPRLRFRYWLKGTDTMKVQIYSLTNGYHRCLTLKGLPQEQWQSGTVDMTQVRRPDGSGGPLSENERIDDIQFYVDPRAELIIDDIVLYDAPVAGEKRPFPKRIHFSGLFDTGKQGKEWPGKFEIVKNGFFWNAAESVPFSRMSHPGMRIDLRGKRPLGTTTHLFFRYHFANHAGIDVSLGTKPKDDSFADYAAFPSGLVKGQWAEATINFSENVINHAGKKVPPKLGEPAVHITFIGSLGAVLRIDDLLLFEPGED
jgi:inosine-uridine nucleoside N-ribohydrolase